MPQVSFEPLPVLKEGEGIEESENLAISILGRSGVVERERERVREATLSGGSE